MQQYYSIEQRGVRSVSWRRRRRISRSVAISVACAALVFTLPTPVASLPSVTFMPSKSSNDAPVSADAWDLFQHPFDPPGSVLAATGIRVSMSPGCQVNAFEPPLEKVLQSLAGNSSGNSSSPGGGERWRESLFGLVNWDEANYYGACSTFSILMTRLKEYIAKVAPNRTNFVAAFYQSSDNALMNVAGPFSPVGANIAVGPGTTIAGVGIPPDFAALLLSRIQGSDGLVQVMLTHDPGAWNGMISRPGYNIFIWSFYILTVAVLIFGILLTIQLVLWRYEHCPRTGASMLKTVFRLDRGMILRLMGIIFLVNQVSTRPYMFQTPVEAIVSDIGLLFSNLSLILLELTWTSIASQVQPRRIYTFFAWFLYVIAVGYSVHCTLDIILSLAPRSIALYKAVSVVTAYLLPPIMILQMLIFIYLGWFWLQYAYINGVLALEFLSILGEDVADKDALVGLRRITILALIALVAVILRASSDIIVTTSFGETTSGYMTSQWLLLIAGVLLHGSIFGVLAERSKTRNPHTPPPSRSGSNPVATDSIGCDSISRQKSSSRSLSDSYSLSIKPASSGGYASQRSNSRRSRLSDARPSTRGSKASSHQPSMSSSAVVSPQFPPPVLPPLPPPPAVVMSRNEMGVVDTVPVELGSFGEETIFNPSFAENTFTASVSTWRTFGVMGSTPPLQFGNNLTPPQVDSVFHMAHMRRSSSNNSTSAHLMAPIQEGFSDISDRSHESHDV